MARRRLEVGEIGRISAKQQADGKWVARCRVRIQDGTIKYAQGTHTARGEAERICRQDAEDKANEGNNEITRNSKLNTLIDSWWEAEEVRAGNGQITTATLNAYGRTAGMVREGIGDTLLIRECTATRLGKFIRDRAGGHYTVHRDLKRILSAVFDHAMALDVVTHNPARAVPGPVVKRKETTVLDADEVMRLRQLVRDYDDGGSNRVDESTGKRKGGRPRERYLADLVDIMLATGTRIGEVLALRWEDIDLGADPVTVEITGTVKTRKADPAAGISYLYRQDHPKSRKSRRIITLPKFAADILLRLHVEAGTSPYVFATTAGTLRSPHNVRNALRKACGTDFEGLTPHTLRRTVATIVEATAGVRTASRLLGHSEVGTTERAYIRRADKAPDTSGILGDLVVPLR